VSSQPRSSPKDSRSRITTRQNASCSFMNCLGRRQPRRLDLALYWSRYADNAAMVTDLAEMLRRYETRMICPAHGSVITEPSKLFAVMDAALRG